MKLKIAVGLFIALILGFTVFGDRGLVSLIKMKRQKEALVRQKEKLEESNRELRQQIDRLRDDYLYIERLAREELGMVKPKEFVFQFPSSSRNNP
ncbi:MAG: septum formation initiator family protein [bacterium]